MKTLIGIFIGLSGVALAQQPVNPLSQFSGVWQREGYGKVLDISEDKVVLYDVTDISCARIEEQTLSEAASELDRFETTATHFNFFEAGGITRYYNRKLPQLPVFCQPQYLLKNADPVANFWAFWHAFQENYAFFELRQVDWYDIAKQYRPQVSEKTTPKELFDIFSEILKKLNDGHVGLEAEGVGEFSSGTNGELAEWWKRENPGAVQPGMDPWDTFEASLKDHVVKDILQGKAKEGANGSLIWGWLAPGVGYLSTMTMSPRLPNSTVEEDPLPDVLRMIDQAMLQALKELRGARTLVVDARFNSGGWDAVALQIAGYLTAQRREVFTKKAVFEGGYTQPQPVYIDPQGKPFTKPVFYLQSGNTVSAAEIFSLAMMALPNVTRVGTPTYGVLSDGLPKTLPNGWTVGMSNEVYIAVDGKLYEGLGIPPHMVTSKETTGLLKDRLQRDIQVVLEEAKK